MNNTLCLVNTFLLSKNKAFLGVALKANLELKLQTWPIGLRNRQ